jgi:hypothetical protein
MGANKSRLPLGKDTLLVRALRMASDLAASCGVIGPPELREHTDAPVVWDAYPGCGRNRFRATSFGGAVEFDFSVRYAIPDARLDAILDRSHDELAERCGDGRRRGGAGNRYAVCIGGRLAQQLRPLSIVACVK